MIRSSIAAISTFVAVGVASAADLPRKTVAPVMMALPAFSWTGFYAGLHGGYGFGTTDWRFNGSAIPTRVKPDGFVGGGQVGFNYQFNQNFLVGLEGSISFADMKKTTTEIFTLANVIIKDAYKAETRLFGDISARAGLTFDRLLVFAKGGIAIGTFKYTNEFSVTGFGSFTASRSDTQTGFLVGAGLEYAFTNYLTAKVEYNYMDFGNKKFGPAFGPSTVGNFGVKTNINIAKAGVNYKF